MSNKKVTLLIEAFRGIPVMNQVLNILEKGEFTDPGDTIPDSSTLIGVMSPMERSIYTLLHQVDYQIKSLGVCPFGNLGIGCLDSFNFELRICPYVEDLTKIKESAGNQEMIRDLMFAIIKDRLDTYKRSFEHVGINEKFQITTRSRVTINQSIKDFIGFEQMNLEELMEVSIEGTFLEQIADILESRQFIDADDAIKESDSFIREMTSFEKAIYTLMIQSIEPLQPLQEEHNNLLQGDAFEAVPVPNIFMELFMDGKKSFRPKDETHPDFLRVEELKKLIKVGYEEIESISNIMWLIIKMNIDPEMENGYDSRAIRAGFKIVVHND